MATPTSNLDLYAVMGNPISHSKSPFIHAQFAKQTHQTMQYIAILAPLDGFAKTVQEFKAMGGKGLNITIPFKQEAWKLANTKSDRAETAQAVNTLIFQKNNLIYGDNTDGVGLIRDLTINHHYALTQKRILIVGAGGAVRGILAPLLAEKPKMMTLTNRTFDKAITLVEQFSNDGCLEASRFDQLKQPFDLIINATSASLSSDLPPLSADILSKNSWCYDLAYSNQPTVFLQWAKQQGAKIYLDGLGMLVEQAAEAFYLWRGVRPETAPVIAMLRKR